MKIDFVEISNYRKLKSCRIDISSRSTIFVGANNCGKTSAMFALIKFLKKRQLVIDDFTISNLVSIKYFEKNYINKEQDVTPDADDWKDICPFIDVWLNVQEDELRYVSDIIPTLSWRRGLIGIRLIYEPKDIGKLYQSYVETYELTKVHSGKVKLWPTDLLDYVQSKMRQTFIMNAYILDEKKLVTPSADNIAYPQKLPPDRSPLDFDPFSNLIRIDTISAQRWFEDSDTDEENNVGGSLLSKQLRDYYDRQLDPERKPSPSDIKALSELETAKIAFDNIITKRFKGAMSELSKFGYPGKYNPGIVIESKVQTSDILSHSTVVKYPIFSDGENEYKLSEKFNGLGYQNLISMSFKLMSFRDSWINGDRRKPEDEDIGAIPPIHLVLIELRFYVSTL